MKPGSYFEGLHDPTNHYVLGKLKDETAGVPISKIVALAPKMYAYTVVEEVKKGKGTEPRRVRVLRGTSWRKISLSRITSRLLFTRRRQTVSEIKAKNKEKRGEDDTFRDELPQLIRTHKHEMYTIEQDRIALTHMDTKRYWINETESLPFGHWRIRAPELHNQLCP